MSNALSHRFCVAPMMDWSDRHCRYFWRLMSREALLYTEMVTTGALIHGDRKRFLDFNSEEHPVALQLGGSDSSELARCAQWAHEWGYDEVNLNCGCPSDRVQSGRFGACLMAEPIRVRDGLKAMLDACDIAVTIKHRIGIDEMESYQEMLDFVATVATSGVTTFIVHARKAWLQGLSPKQNREIPPLHYDWVYQLKQDLPDLEIVLNGGINSLEECRQHLDHVDGVMLGREAYSNPYLLAAVDQSLFDDEREFAGREDILLELLPYIEQQMAQGVALHHISRHVLGLFQNVPGARKFRRHVSEHAYKSQAPMSVLTEALELVQQETRRAQEREVI
jgi:tRNA-dihydrouridine synthase A